MTELLLACARVEVTPPAGSALAGYLARDQAVSQGCHDPLEATLLWLRDLTTGQDVIWVSLDVLGIDVELSHAVAASVAQAVGCAEAAVLVCASHTHSSAAVWYRSQGNDHDGADADGGGGEGAELRGHLVKQIAGAAGLLPPRLRPVRLLFAQGRVNGVGANRHRIDGPHDDTVGLLAAVDEAGSVSAVLVDYASHPTVLGHDNVLWSADWPGAARRALADALARLVPFPGQAAGKVGTLEEPVVLFLQGAAGDSSARFVRRGQSFAEVDRLGGLFAGQALTALLGAQDNPTTGPVVVCRRTVTVPTRAPTPLNVVAERVDQTRAEWEAVQRSQANGSVGERIARTRHEGALAALRMAETGLPPTVELPLTVVAIGKQAWVHVPVELFASFGLRIRAESPFAHTRVVGYTDGYFGYAPDASAYEGGAYEAGVSMFDAGGSEFLCQSAIGLVHETARRASGTGSGRDGT